MSIIWKLNNHVLNIKFKNSVPKNVYKARYNILFYYFTEKEINSSARNTGHVKSM